MDTIKKLFPLKNKFLTYLLISTLLPLIYSTLRVFWVLDINEQVYAMSNFWVYIELVVEVVGAFIIMPFFAEVNTKLEENIF